MDSDAIIEGLISNGSFSLLSKDLNLEMAVGELAKLVNCLPDFHNPICFVGGVASGKTTLSNKLAEALGNSVTIGTDDFVINTREWRRVNVVAQNKSPLLKYDFELLEKIVNQLQSSDFKIVLIPKYDEFTGLAVADSLDNYRKIEKKPEYIIIEGDFQAFPNPGLQIYFHVSDQVRTNNRLRRDQQKRNATDKVKLLADIKTRDEQQHFPFTLPQAEKSNYLLTAVPSDGGEYKYCLYQKSKI